MEEINSNNPFEEDDEYKKLLWDQLTANEKTTMKMYCNNLKNDKDIHITMMKSVNSIMERYPDFDMSCVP